MSVVTSRNLKFLLLVISDSFRSKHNNNSDDDDNAPDPPIATPFDSTCTNGKDIALHTRDRQGESYGNGVAIIGRHAFWWSNDLRFEVS